MRYIVVLALLVFGLTSCVRNSRTELAKAKAGALQKTADSINNDFARLKLQITELTEKVRQCYQDQDKIIPSIDKKKYETAANGVFYKKINDGGSAVFVSGYYPITQTVKNIVYTTEPLDTFFQKSLQRYPEIAQLYFNDEYSINRIYPFFDVLVQYEPKMNIPAFNFYFLADSLHNPSKGIVWVNEPYVDPAGRGWMISLISPCYFKNHLVGVPGIDITINTITDRYLKETKDRMVLLMDSTGVIVTASERIINLMSFPPLKDHKYTETIKLDTYRKENYSMPQSKEQSVRVLAYDIMIQKKLSGVINLAHEEFLYTVCFIPELQWYILEIF